MTPTTALPAAVTTYFTRMDAAEKRDIIDLFTADAVVTDDGHSYRGRDQIAAWLAAAASEYTVTTTRLSTEVVGETVTVTTRLEGNFPGGLVDLRNIFALDTAGLIESLLITV
ncbi:nuclear transport factor 2 family protein [Cryobacterium arcticum]|uniref:SnoaL-like domain-containing protein n=1 Tax=Cryobacterium arcticum TaxID=670052 RepID=A0A1B1BP95_9MICO|nr:nuclear transport factor 2 family protein [Cryobacterium arcticum]ANP74472.1 hypothetical protein PA27867_3550 [Cryobacterium arcticum]